MKTSNHARNEFHPASFYQKSGSFEIACQLKSLIFDPGKGCGFP